MIQQEPGIFSYSVKFQVKLAHNISILSWFRQKISILTNPFFPLALRQPLQMNLFWLRWPWFSLQSLSERKNEFDVGSDEILVWKVTSSGRSRTPKYPCPTQKWSGGSGPCCACPQVWVSIHIKDKKKVDRRPASEKKIILVPGYLVVFNT